MTRVLAGALPVRHPQGELIMWREHLAVNQSLRLCRFDSCLAHRSRRPRRRRTSLAAESAAERPKLGRPSSTLGRGTEGITRCSAVTRRHRSAAARRNPHMGIQNAGVTPDSSDTRNRVHGHTRTRLR